jgi:hypothetical protein
LLLLTNSLEATEMLTVHAGDVKRREVQSTISAWRRLMLSIFSVLPIDWLL